MKSRKKVFNRVLSFILAITMVLPFASTTMAAEGTGAIHCTQEVTLVETPVHNPQNSGTVQAQSIRDGLVLLALWVLPDVFIAPYALVRNCIIAIIDFFKR